MEGADELSKENMDPEREVKKGRKSALDHVEAALSEVEKARTSYVIDDPAGADVGSRLDKVISELTSIAREEVAVEENIVEFDF
jgi:hypothetical protein